MAFVVGMELGGGEATTKAGWAGAKETGFLLEVTEMAMFFVVLGLVAAAEDELAATTGVLLRRLAQHKLP